MELLIKKLLLFFVVLLIIVPFDGPLVRGLGFKFPPSNPERSRQKIPDVGSASEEKYFLALTKLLRTGKSGELCLRLGERWTEGGNFSRGLREDTADRGREQGSEGDDLPSLDRTVYHLGVDSEWLALRIQINDGETIAKIHLCQP